MINLGQVRPGTNLDILFQTFDSNDPSASVTITNFGSSQIEILKDGSTTPRVSEDGYVLLGGDGIDEFGTGVHGFSVDLADDSTGDSSGFYEAGSQYHVVVQGITVDAATINFIAATFEIGYSDAILNTTIATLASQISFTLEEGSTNDDAYNGFGALVHNLASAIQIAHGITLDYTGATKTITLATDPGIFTMAAGDNISLFMPVLLPTISLDNINAECSSAIETSLNTAVPELGVAQPTATPTLRTGMMLPYMTLRNETEMNTSSTDAIRINNDGGTLIAQKLVTDDGSDYIEAKMISG